MKAYGDDVLTDAEYHAKLSKLEKRERLSFDFDVYDETSMFRFVEYSNVPRDGETLDNFKTGVDFVDTPSGAIERIAPNSFVDFVYIVDSATGEASPFLRSADAGFLYSFEKAERVNADDISVKVDDALTALMSEITAKTGYTNWTFGDKYWETVTLFAHCIADQVNAQR